MMDSPTLPAWAATIIEHIQQSNFARIESVILNAAEQPPLAHPAPLPTRLWRILRDKRRRSQLLYSLYFKWEDQRCSIPNDPGRAVDCSGKLADCPIIPVAPIAKGFTHRFSPDDLEIVRLSKVI